MNTSVTRVRVRRRARLFAYLCFAVLALAVVALLGSSLHTSFISGLDQSAGDMVRNAKSPFLDGIARMSNALDSTLGFGILTVLLALGCLAFRKPLDAILTVSSTVMAWGLNTLFKHIFERPRPSLDALFAADGYSYPSGTATITAALLGFAAVAFASYARSAAVKGAVIGGMLLLIAALSISRVYAGVHYMSDIVGGICLGLAVLLVMTGIRNRKHQ
jgi:undecaprenyl-diphosphatase